MYNICVSKPRSVLALFVISLELRQPFIWDEELRLQICIVVEEFMCFLEKVHEVRGGTGQSDCLLELLRAKSGEELHWG